jgi:predicted AAA+ superfamily ATPase
MGKRKYSKKQKEFAKQLLRSSDTPRDALPYTREFDKLYRKYSTTKLAKIDKHTFWQLLCRAGKEGGARYKKTEEWRISKKVRRIPNVTQDDAFELMRLCPEAIGSRDRLPYTTEFNDMYRLFIDHTGRRLTKSEFWRVLSRLAKRSRKPEAVEYSPTTSAIPQALERHLFRINPWWQDKPMKSVPQYRRSIYQTLFDKITTGSMPIVSVRGPRQSGKTTLQLQMINDILIRKRLVKPAQILRIQFDDLPSLGKVHEPILSIVDWYEKNILRDSINTYAVKKQPVFIFLDELQNLKAWDAQLKAFVDHTDCRVYITGSSALRIQHGRDSLAGRIDQRDLGLLSLPEIAGFRKCGNLKAFDPQLELPKWVDISFWDELSHYDGGMPLIVDSVFGDYSNMGGYPYCHNRQDRDWATVSTYLNQSVVERTIQHDLRVGGVQRDAKILREVFKLAARYTGQAPKMKTLATELGNVMEGEITASDVIKYLDFIENSLLLKLVTPLELRTKKQGAPPKICICDHAIRAAWLQEKVSLVDAEGEIGENHDCGLVGHIIEGIVGYFLSRVSGLGLSYFPERHNEPEVDFIMVIGDSRIPIEVKYRPNAMRDKFTKGLKAFMAKTVNNASFGIMISKEDSGRYGKIVAVPAKRFLLLQ